MHNACKTLFFAIVLLGAQVAAAHQLIVTVGVAQSLYSPGNDQSPCHPNNFFLMTEFGNSIADRISTDGDSGGGSSTFTVQDPASGSTRQARISCDAWSNPDLTFAGFRIKEDPRVQLTRTCDNALIRYESGANERVWRERHEVCRELYTQLSPPL